MDQTETEDENFCRYLNIAKIRNAWWALCLWTCARPGTRTRSWRCGNLQAFQDPCGPGPSSGHPVGVVRFNVASYQLCLCFFFLGKVINGFSCEYLAVRKERRERSCWNDVKYDRLFQVEMRKDKGIWRDKNCAREGNQDGIVGDVVVLVKYITKNVNGLTEMMRWGQNQGWTLLWAWLTSEQVNVSNMDRELKFAWAFRQNPSASGGQVNWRRIN